MYFAIGVFLLMLSWAFWTGSTNPGAPYQGPEYVFWGKVLSGVCGLSAGFLIVVAIR